MSQQINLFNPIFLKEKKYFSAVTMVQALGMILVGMLAMWGYSQYQARSLNQEATKATAQLAAAQQQLAKIKAEYGARPRSQAIEDELKRAQEEQAAMQQALTRLQGDELGNRKGYSAYLRGFARQIVDGLWLTGFSIDAGGQAIGIRGRALQPEAVPAYINRLKQESVLQGKSFATLEMQQPQAAEKKTPDAAPAIKPDAPAFIEFDLRAAGIEKAKARAANPEPAQPSASAAAPPPAVKEGAGVKGP